MNIQMQSSYTDLKDDTATQNYVRSVERDLANIFLFAQGRVRFGDGANRMGENISGQFVTYTTNATPNAEDTVAHLVGASPIGYIVIKKDKAGDIYSGTTTWTSSNIYLKCTVASVTVTLFLLK